MWGRCCVGSQKPWETPCPPSDHTEAGEHQQHRCSWWPHPKFLSFSDLFFVTHIWPTPTGHTLPQMLRFLSPWFLCFSALALCWLYSLWKLLESQMGGRAKTSFIHCPPRLQGTQQQQQWQNNNSHHDWCISSVYYKLGISHCALQALIYLVPTMVLRRRY